MISKFSLFSQVSTLQLSIKSDSMEFTDQSNKINLGSDSYIYFIANDQQPVLTIQLRLNQLRSNEQLFFLPNDNYAILDSLKQVTPGIFSGKVRLNDLLSFPKPVLSVGQGSTNYTFKLLPVIIPVANAEFTTIDAFQEEQKTIEIPVSNGFNIKTDNSVLPGKEFDYKLTSFLNYLVVTFKPHLTGTHQLEIPLKSVIPVIDNKGNITNNLQELLFKVNVKSFKLSYINFDRNTIFYSYESKGSQQILVDHNPLFEQNKTYRIEDQQTPGGNLVAELYVESIVENNKKIICRIKPFTFHKIQDGYLYIKDAEKNRFICNINISEKPKIEKVFVRKNGGDWNETLTVHPGEQIEIRIQGKGLDLGKIQFDGITDAKGDSVKSSDEVLYYHMFIPVSISNKHVSIFLDRKETVHQLQVKEFKKPSPFDFVSVNYGQNDITITDEKLNKPVFYDGIIKDINLRFDPNKIDSKAKLQGKQYFSLEIRLLNKDNDLIEIETIENLVVCPGEQSPRNGHYDETDCNEPVINVNDYLDHKTYNLPAFTQIVIRISHDENKYDDTKGYKKKIRLILVRKYNYDLQLSFPTGLLVKDFGEGGGINNLSGISAAVLFNITPYEEKNPGKLKPYSLGAGFLALNALNLSTTASTDLGIVIMGTVQPFRKNAKFSVPIYLGYGYFVKSGRFFEILGPGLQFNF
ncbi:MAG: hypothetical protein ACHQK8_05185 [Bacteroidia bacterium]